MATVYITSIIHTFRSSTEGPQLRTRPGIRPSTEGPQLCTQPVVQGDK